MSDKISVVDRLDSPLKLSISLYFPNFSILNSSLIPLETNNSVPLTRLQLFTRSQLVYVFT